ncbi:MAG: DUF4920 domain-containing protein [Chitinophagaceae bacterium]
MKASILYTLILRIFYFLVKQIRLKRSNAQEFCGKITEDGALPVDSITSLLQNSDEQVGKLKGEISAVCQKKGCWMELTKQDGSLVRVTFKDYGFFMPKDASGKTAIVEGIAKREITSVADLKEYAKDNGDSQQTIDTIKTPLEELVFEAKGVIIQ